MSSTKLWNSKISLKEVKDLWYEAEKNSKYGMKLQLTYSTRGKK